MGKLSNLTQRGTVGLLKGAGISSGKGKVNKNCCALSLIALCFSTLVLSGCVQPSDPTLSKEADSDSTTKSESRLDSEKVEEQGNRAVFTITEQELEGNLISKVTTQQSKEDRAYKRQAVSESIAQGGALEYKHQPLQIRSMPLSDIKQRVNEPRDKFAQLEVAGIKLAKETPVSTFSVDVDTGGYSIMRRWIKQGNMPTQNTVRVEELINYFHYHYPVPKQKGSPFSITTELATSPYNHGRQILRLGVQGYEVDKANVGASNFVFLLDVSGSMSSPDKLPLVKKALILLTKQLDEKDSVSIVVYAGASGVVLDGETGNNTQAITRALKKLTSGGSTNGGAGIKLAYDLALKHFIDGGNNRVILATDGDFNLGITDQAALERLIQQQKKQGVYLTTLGFGQGNYNDVLMEQLADKGNGNYAYIDTLNEAKKVLVDELTSQVFTIANDVKIQVEFNPAVVEEYRLIGYQNRRLKREDFNNDKVDAGEIGAGHSVTALYEISYVDGENLANDPLRYQSASDSKVETHQNELAHIKLRFKPSHDASSQLIGHFVERPLSPVSIDVASVDFKFAVAVAGFGQLLNGGRYMQDFDYDQVEPLASSSMGEDKFGYRHEFLQLVKTAALLKDVSEHLSPDDEAIAERHIKPVLKWEKTPDLVPQSQP